MTAPSTNSLTGTALTDRALAGAGSDTRAEVGSTGGPFVGKAVTRLSLAIGWIALVVVTGILAPLLASGHPLLLRRISSGELSSPLLARLGPIDLVLVVWLLVTGGGLLLRRRWVGGLSRAAWLGWTSLLLVSALAGLATAELAGALLGSVGMTPGAARAWLKLLAGPCIGVGAIGGLAWFVMARVRVPRRGLSGVVIGGLALSAGVVGGAMAISSPPELERFGYTEAERRGEIAATMTLVPFSPSQAQPDRARLAPGSRVPGAAPSAGQMTPTRSGRFWLGTDGLGRDVLSQMLHGCRVAIFVGLISTGIAVLIGVTVGAAMGYFGGWVDLLLLRVVEVVMSVPVLFVLILAAAVLPRSTAVMMAIIGCVTWTGPARQVRAAFLRLKGQEFVLAARATGIPAWRVMFVHMLPNAITPVLIEASFAIAAAIQVEALLSFLSLGPVDQASWGVLLSGAISDSGAFRWWLAVFPGVAIFLTAWSYNTLGNQRGGRPERRAAEGGSGTIGPTTVSPN